MLSEPRTARGTGPAGAGAPASDPHPGPAPATVDGTVDGTGGLAVRATGVGKRFDVAGGDDVVALDAVDLEVRPGDFVSLVGPSGCGKSTFLNLLAGLVRPTAGALEVHGGPVTGPHPEMGMMFQKPVLLQWRTVRDNVLLPVELERGRRAARSERDRADGLLDMVGLSDFANRYPHELSGGMQQRAAICRMLIGDPTLLLLDEPFGALDELTREHLNVELATVVSGTRKAALLVTHNIQEALFLSDRVVVMSARPGRIVGVVEVDLPRPRSLDIVTEPAFQDGARQVRSLLHAGQAGGGDGAPSGDGSDR